MGYHFQSDDGAYQREYKEDTPEGYRLFKEENTHKYGTHRTNAGPYSVTRSQG